MFYLEKLRNDKIYKNIKIVSINKKKELNKGDCIVSLGNSEQDMINLINNNLFIKNYYKSIYTPRIVTNTINNKKVYVNLQEYYKKINNETNVSLVYKKSIPEFKGKNLYYDASKEIQSFFTYERRKGINRLKDFITSVDITLNNITKYYKSIALYIPIDTKNKAINNSYFSINSLGKDNIQFFYQIFKNDEYFEMFKDVVKDNNLTLVFHDVNSNLLFKVEMNSESIKRQKSLTLLKTLIKNSNGTSELTTEEKTIIGEVNEKNEEEIINSEEDKLELKRIDKANEVVNSVKKSLDLNTKKLTAQEINLLDKITQTTTNLIDEENINNNQSILEKMEDSEEFKQYLMSLKEIQKVGNSNSERVKELTEKQNDIDYKGIKIKDIIGDYSESKIEKHTINQPSTVFENVKQCTLKDFDDSYMEKEFNKDLLKVVSAFSEDDDIKLFVENIEEEITSDDLTKKKTMTINFKDDRNVKHTVKVDIPLIKDGRFMYVNGSRKLIQKQIFLKPIVKLKPDEVQVISNYNKFIIRRFGRKLSETTEVYKKFLLSEDFSEYLKPNSKLKFKLGNSVIINNTFDNNILYNYYSNFLINLENEEKILIFNYGEIDNLINTNNNIHYDKVLSLFEFDTERYQMIGYYKNKKTIILVNKTTSEITLFDKVTYTTNNMNINQLVGSIIKEEINEEGIKKINSLTKPKSLTFTRVLINNKELPMIVLLGYEKGLTRILERYNIKYVFTKTNKKPDILSDSVSKIKFEDGYLYYESSKLRNSLLLSGLSVLHTEAYAISEFDTVNPYIEYFSSSFGSRNTGKGLHNTLSLMVDPITRDVLEKLELPTNIIDILLYANTLLEDNTYSNENDMNNYRIRGAEQVNAMLYKLIADSVRIYKDTLKNGNPKKVSLPPDILIKKIVELPTVDEHSTLNPSLEIEKYASATYKGLSGKNTDNAYTPTIRTYDQSMVGVFGYSSPDSDKVGVVRYLSYNPNLVNTRGFIDTSKENLDTTKDLYTPAELLNPFTTKHADPPRIGMQSTQQKHIIPVKKTDRALVGSGVEKTVPYIIGDDFIFKAKKDGIVEKIDEENNLVIIKYKDGSKDIIDLTPVMSKNSNGGFFTKNVKELIVKEGEKFGKGDILAKNGSYFLGKNQGDISYTMGSLSKVAITSSDGTYEDSSLITSKLTDDMTSYLTMKKEMVLGPNTTVEYLANVGQKIHTGDPLIIFENSFEDESINDLLSKLGDEFEETVNALSKNTYRSKYTGTIVDIKIYYNRPMTELSPSLQKYVKKYINKANKKKKVILENASEEALIDMNLPATEQQAEGKIKGVDVDGVMIEFYIEYEDSLGVGDKITFYGSCKTIISDIMQEGEEPYSELHEDENIDAVISPLSLISRMTIDVYMSLYLNKCMIELKNKCKEIYNK